MSAICRNDEDLCRDKDSTFYKGSFELIAKRHAGGGHKEKGVKWSTTTSLIRKWAYQGNNDYYLEFSSLILQVSSTMLIYPLHLQKIIAMRILHPHLVSSLFLMYPKNFAL
jgi:hypothetical protein